MKGYTAEKERQSFWEYQYQRWQMNDMQDTWIDTISEILSFLTYGWSFHEIVYKRRMGNTKDPRTKSKYNDGSAYRSSVIYEATVEEDRKKIWDNQAAWGKLDVLSGYQLIEKVMKGGEKDYIYGKIEEISGYDSMEEIAKN